MKTVMPLLLLLLSGCVSASPEVARKPNPVIVQWQGCVVSSYVSNRKASVEKNLAAEQAFLACQTEERAIAAPFAYDPYFHFQVMQVIAANKASVKAKLMAAG